MKKETAIFLALCWMNVFCMMEQEDFVRRGLNLLCKRPSLAGVLASTFLESVRDTMKRSEPIKIGDGPNFEIFSLQNGKLWGVWSLYLRKPFDLLCDEEFLNFTFDVGLNNTELQYQWSTETSTVPYQGGRLSIFAKHLGIDSGLLIPRNVSSGRGEAGGVGSGTNESSVTVDHLRITDMHGVFFNLTGYWPYTDLFSNFLNVLVNTFPDEARQLFSEPLKKNLQKYLEDSRIF